MSGIVELAEVKRQKLVEKFGKSEIVNSFCGSIENLTKEINLHHPMFYAWYSVFAELEDGEDFMYEILLKKHTQMDIQTCLAKLQKPEEPITCSNVNRFLGKSHSKCGNCPNKGKMMCPMELRGRIFYSSEWNNFFEAGLDINRPKKMMPHVMQVKDKIVNEYQLIVVDGNDEAYSFNGKFYEFISKSTLLSIVQKFTNEKYLDRERVEVYKAIIGDPAIRKKADWFQASIEDKINFPNGVYDFKTLSFGPHKKEYGFLSVMDYEYDPKAKTDKFTKFLYEVSNEDSEWCEVMCQIIGHTLVPGPNKTEKGFWFYGELSSNGKGTLCRLIKSLLPHGACTAIRIENLGDESYLIKLLKAQMNFADEANSVHPNKMVGLANSLSSLITGEPMDVRGKFRRDAIELENRARMFFTSNEMPDLEKLKGLERRFLYIPFDRVFDENNKDKDILQKLMAERAGIFNLAIESYKTLRGQNFKFSTSKRIEMTTKTIKETRDAHVEFIYERMEHSPGSEVSKKYLREQYVKVMDEMGVHPLNDVHFGRLIGKAFNLTKLDLSYKRRASDGGFDRFIRNVRFKSIYED